MAHVNFEEFFETYELETIKNVFIENEFTSFLGLTEVTDEDLKEMGVKALGKRRQFLAAVKDVIGKSQNENKDTSENLKVLSDVDDDLPEFDLRKKEPAAKRKLEDIISSQDKDGQETPKKQAKTDSSLKNWLKSPFNPSKILNAKKINLYTDAEIKKSHGLRRKKMEFMNTKLIQLIEDPSVRGQNKTMILGMAEVAWDRYNAEEAKIDEIEVQSLVKTLEKKGHTYNEKQMKTIKKDSERVNRALSDIKVQLKRIQETKDNKELEKKEKKSQIDILENDLAEMHRELQKATDALRKACGVRIVQLQAIIKQLKTDDELCNDETEVDSDSDIISEIKCPVESNE